MGLKPTRSREQAAVVLKEHVIFWSPAKAWAHNVGRQQPGPKAQCKQRQGQRPNAQGGQIGGLKPTSQVWGIGPR